MSDLSIAYNFWSTRYIFVFVFLWFWFQLFFCILWNRFIAECFSFIIFFNERLFYFYNQEVYAGCQKITHTKVLVCNSLNNQKNQMRLSKSIGLLLTGKVQDSEVITSCFHIEAKSFEEKKAMGPNASPNFVTHSSWRDFLHGL